MVDQRLIDRLTAIAGPGGVQVNRPLAPLTTFHVGGPADFVVEARDARQIVETLAAAREAGVPVTVLGGGSNVLIGDRGIRSLAGEPAGGHQHAAIVRAEQHHRRGHILMVDFGAASAARARLDQMQISQAEQIERAHDMPVKRHRVGLAAVIGDPIG